MKKPNVTKFLALIGAIGLGGSLAAAPALSTDSTVPAPADAGPAAATAPATPTGPVPLKLTPEALAKDKKEIKLNLAKWYTGASIIEVGPTGSLKSISFADRDDSRYSVLLEDDSTLSVALPNGLTRLIVDLRVQQTIERFGFLSLSAGGSVEVSYSNANLVRSVRGDDWKPANINVEFKPKEAVSVNVQPIEARFVLITLRVTTPGDIGSLAIFGTVTNGRDKAVAPKQEINGGQPPPPPSDNPNDVIEFDYAKQAFGSKVTHVAGGDATNAQNILNSDPNSKLLLGNLSTTSPSPANTTTPGGGVSQQELDNIMVVDMGQNREIDKVALLFATRGGGKFEFYFLKDLPTEESPQAATRAAPQPAAQASTAPLSPASAPTPSAAIWQRADGRRVPLLLAASRGSLAEALALARLAAEAGPADTSPTDTRVDYLPQDFFETVKPNMVQGVNTNQEKVQLNLTRMDFRYCLIRWVPASPNQPPLEVFRVNLIGRVSPQDYADGSRSTASNVGTTPVVPEGPSITPDPNTGNLNTNVGRGGGGSGTGGGNGPTPPDANPDPDPPQPVPRPPPPVSL